MSKFIAPCVAVPGECPPTGDRWLHEAKLDGFRLQIVKDGDDVTLFSRTGKDFTQRFQSVAIAARKLESTKAILDAEVVVLNNNGLPDFSALVNSCLAGIVVYCFDALTHDGEDLRPLPLVQRRQHLVRLVDSDSLLRHTQTFEDPIALFAACDALGIEGVVSKLKDAPYRSGTFSGWIKSKTPTWRAANRERYKLFHKPLPD
jgi:bifunctional non-homologous end joining protein LigD